MTVIKFQILTYRIKKNINMKKYILKFIGQTVYSDIIDNYLYKRHSREGGNPGRPFSGFPPSRE